MISLRHIEVFHAVMRTGSITGAARMLNVTQPAISAVIKHFENRLNMPLFERVGGRLRPTPEAQALLPDISEIFGRIDALERLTQDLAGGLRGVLSIAATSPLANGYVAKAVSSFQAERPGVRVTLQSIPSPMVLNRVVNREVDLGVAYEPMVSPMIDTLMLTRTQVACVMPVDHPLARQTDVTLADLAPYSVITYLPQALLRPYVDRALSEAGVALNISAEVGLSITGIMLAFHGAGIALVEPDLLLAMPLPGLTSRPLRPNIKVKSLILWNRSATPPRLQQAFIQHLCAVVQTAAADSCDR